MDLVNTILHRLRHVIHYRPPSFLFRPLCLSCAERVLQRSQRVVTLERENINKLTLRDHFVRLLHLSCSPIALGFYRLTMIVVL